MPSTRPTLISTLFFCALTGSACESVLDGYTTVPPGGPSGGAPGTFGATPGGAKDIGYARDVIAQGGVPEADSITVEGLLSEYDLPTDGAPCDELLCVRPSLALAPSLETGDDEYWIQIGMVSGLKTEDFRRPPLDLVLLVDKSESMSIDIDETTEAVARSVDRMRDDDRIAVIAFDDGIHELKPLEAPGDREALKTEVRALDADGGWNLSGALARASDILAQRGTSPGRMGRVMIFSCGTPLVSSERDDEFSRFVGAAAEQGVGVSFFGVLLAHDPAVTDLLAETHGGASYYLQDLEKVEQVFDVDFDAMVTPLAYDLHLELEVPAGLTLRRFYGIPADEEGKPRREVSITTAFLSNRRGAILARLFGSVPGSAPELGTVRLGYTPESAFGFEPTDEQVVALAVTDHADSAPVYYQGTGVRKAVALVNEATQIQAACRAYASGDAPAAREILDELITYLEAESAAVGGADLQTEVALVEKLRENMGAP